MTYSLRPYQIEDVQKLSTVLCGGCFNEQRTGKTPTSIRVMLDRHLDKILIVTTTAMLYAWRTAWMDWSDGQPVVVCLGSAIQREEIISNWQHGALIISYGCLRQTVKSVQTSHDTLTAILKQKPNAVIADEAHKFRNYKTATAKAMYKLCCVPYRLALTGTPAINKPEDIYGILHWLYPKTFSSYWKFINENFQMNTRYLGYGRSFKEVGNWLPGRKRAMALLLNTFTTNRKRKDVMAWLPEKDYQDIKLPPTPEQLQYIKELTDFWETHEIVTQGVLDQLLRIRQICTAPQLLDLPGESPKLNWICDYFTDYPDRPTIVFTKFVKSLEILQEALQRKGVKCGVIHGAVPATQRTELVDQFQAGQLNCMLIQIDAGKEGLTLDRAECAIFIEQFPPAADIQQAEDRFVSTTLNRADKPHHIIRLKLEGTYDEVMYQLVEHRANTIDVINNYKAHLKGGKTS